MTSPHTITLRDVSMTSRVELSPRNCSNSRSPSPHEVCPLSPRAGSSLDMPSFNPPFQYTLGSIRRNLDGEGFQLDVVAIPNEPTQKTGTSPVWETTFERNYPMKTESIFCLDASTSILGENRDADLKPSDGLNLDTFATSMDFEGDSLTKCDFDPDNNLHTSDFDSEIHRFSSDFDPPDIHLSDAFAQNFERDDHGLATIDFESENHLTGNVTFDSENCFDSNTDFDEDHPFRTSHFDADHLSSSHFDNDI